MARATKIPATWDSIFFSSPEQKVLRYLLSSRDTTYTLRVLVSKLKGVRGLGGIQGLEKILTELEEAGLVHFIDNRRAVRVSDEHSANLVYRRLWGLVELESLYVQLQPLSSKGVLLATAPGEINLYVVTDQPEEVRKLTEQHPMGKLAVLTLQTRDQFDSAAKKDPKLWALLNQGVRIWGSSW
jgi:hypothetical protein